MLVRQIGTVTEGAIQTDEQILLAESGGGGGAASGGGQQPDTLNPQPPAGATDATVSPTSVPNVSNVAPGGSAIVKHPLLWAGVGIGAAYLLSRGGDTVSGIKKKSLLVPALIVGGAAVAWYFLKKPAAANTERDWLLNTFHATNESNQQAMLAAIPNMNDSEIHYLYLRAQAQTPGTNITLSDADKAGIDAMMAKFGLAGL